MALASATLFEASKLNLELAAGIIDHGLQPQSAKVASATKKKLLELGFREVEIVRVRVGSRGGPEAAARKARYLALEQLRIAVGAHFVLLGHTMDDQAETVMLGLVRGSGARSLSGMSEKTGTLLRPLLSIGRETTEQFCADENISYWSDPQNKDLRYLRVLLRNKILPYLEKKLGGGIKKNLIRSADQLRQDDAYLSEIAQKRYKKLASFAGQSLNLSVSELEKLPAAVMTRVLKYAIDSFGGESSRSHVMAVSDLVWSWHGQKPLALPGVRVVRKGNTIRLSSNQEQ
jgi:tRNA(Ile)-lysidine synthase